MDLSIYYIWIAHASSISTLVPLTAFILAIKKKKEQPIILKLLWVLIITSGLSDLITFLIFHYKVDFSVNIVGSLYTVLQFVIISRIYSHEDSFFKKASFVLIPAFLVLAFCNLFLQGLTGINSNMDTLSAILFFSYSLIHLCWLFVHRLSAANFSHCFMFWFNLAVFIYFGCNVFTFLTLEHLIESDTSRMLSMWEWHNVSNIVKNMIFAAGFYAAMRFDQSEFALEEVVNTTDHH